MPALQILADENIPAARQYFGELGRVRHFRGRELSADQLSGADILLVRSVTRVDEALLAGSPVRFVGTATSGVDHLDTAWLVGAGIPWAHAPGSNANSVVEYVLAAIAGSADHLERLLAGGSLGIVGYGHIGRAVASRFRALGVRTLVSDPWLDQSTITGAAQLKQLLDCDVMSLHCELTGRQPWPSRHLLGAGELARLGPEQLLINASRGPVVDGGALRERLERGDGPVAVLDVWEQEPRVEPALLSQLLYGTPHIAGYSSDGKLLATRMLLQAACEALQLAPPQRIEAPQVPALEFPRTETDAEAIRHLIGARYDIGEDDRALRRALQGCDEQQARSAFDRLRREYPVRRELGGSEVFGTDNERQAALCRALGCRIAGEGA